MHLDYHKCYEQRYSTHPKARLVYPKPSKVYMHSLNFSSILNSPFDIHISCQPSSYSFLKHIRYLYIIETSSVLFTELDCLWNRNIAVLLYNPLSGHGGRKGLPRMINPYYNSAWCYFSKQLVVSYLLPSLFNFFRLVPDWFRPHFKWLIV